MKEIPGQNNSYEKKINNFFFFIKKCLRMAVDGLSRIKAQGEVDLF